MVRLGKITNEMVHYSYETAKHVYEGVMSHMEGRFEIYKTTGMDEGPAGDYITAFLAMLNGECYKHTINLYVTEYLLENIGIDFGREAQKRAAQAVTEHVQYYKTVQAYLVKTDKLVHKYL